MGEEGESMGVWEGYFHSASHWVPEMSGPCGHSCGTDRTPGQSRGGVGGVHRQCEDSGSPEWADRKQRLLGVQGCTCN